MAAMPNDQPKRSRWPGWTLAALLLAVLYVLSVGPAAWVNEKLDTPRLGGVGDALIAIYDPVFYAAERIPGANWLLFRYLHCFVSPEWFLRSF